MTSLERPVERFPGVTRRLSVIGVVACAQGVKRTSVPAGALPELRTRRLRRCAPRNCTVDGVRYGANERAAQRCRSTLADRRTRSVERPVRPRRHQGRAPGSRRIGAPRRESDPPAAHPRCPNASRFRRQAGPEDRPGGVQSSVQGLLANTAGSDERRRGMLASAAMIVCADVLGVQLVRVVAA